MNIPFLDLARIEEDLKKRLIDRFSEVLDQGIFSGGEEVVGFERLVSGYLSSSHAIACANGTDALELALRALGIGVGDEVIVPAMTWVSTAEAVVLVGAKPVFWDTDQWGLLRSDWEMAVSSRTKALIPVHLYGGMVEMKPLIERAKNLGLSVIEDAAQAFGAFQKGKAAGTWGEVGCLSFYPTKNLGALGEAGMCFTQDSDLARKIKLLLNHGQPIRDQHLMVGRNSRMDSIQAAFLQVILADFDKKQKSRKEIAGRYLEAFSGISELDLPEGILNSDHNAHLFVIQTQKRDQLRSFLAENGIGTAIHYPKILPDMEPFFTRGSFENARNLAQNGLSLPLNPYLAEEEQNFIVNLVKKFFE